MGSAHGLAGWSGAGIEKTVSGEGAGLEKPRVKGSRGSAENTKIFVSAAIRTGEHPPGEGGA